MPDFVLISIMAGIKLDENGEFIVKQWGCLAIGAGLVYLMLGVMIIINSDFGTTTGIMVVLIKAAVLLLVPGLIFFFRGTDSSVILRINSDGIYYYGKMVTDWDNFYNAYVSDKPRTGSFQDNFILSIEHYRDDLLYRKNIPLTNTQNQSEEDIYAAIMHFYKEWQQAVS